MAHKVALAAFSYFLIISHSQEKSTSHSHNPSSLSRCSIWWCSYADHIHCQFCMYILQPYR